MADDKPKRSSNSEEDVKLMAHYQQAERARRIDSGLLERYLVFRLGKEDFAVPLLKVKEVIAVPETTPVPNSPDYYLGLMNLRGQVLSVLDLRKKIGAKIPENKEEQAVVIVDLHPTYVGVVVDAVKTVLALSDADIQETPEMENQKKIEYVSGVTHSGDQLILILDIVKTLNLSDLESITQKAG